MIEDLSTRHLTAIAIAEITRRLSMFDRLERERQELRVALDRAARLIDYFNNGRPLVTADAPAEIKHLYADHFNWIERQRRRGDFLSAACTKRAVAKRRKRK